MCMPRSSLKLVTATKSQDNLTVSRFFYVYLYLLHTVLGAFAKLHKATFSFVMSVYLFPTGRNFMKFENIHVSLKSDTNKGYFK